MTQSTQYIVLGQEISEFLIRVTLLDALSYFLGSLTFILTFAHKTSVRLSQIIGEKLTAPLKYFVCLNFLLPRD